MNSAATQPNRFAMYSATRQWNPGDEFILSGSRRIVDTALGPFDPVIYDRNPDVRPSDGTTVALRNEKRPVAEPRGGIYEKFSAYLRMGFFSNSVKFDSDVSWASLAVFGGSPEWATPRCWSFYDHVFRNKLPLLGLGIGSMPDGLPGFMHTALEKAVLMTTRSRSLAETDLAKRYGIGYLPCPALLSAPASRQVSRVRRVAVAIGVPYEQSVWANGLEPDFYEIVCAALDGLFASFGDEITFDLVAHYIDELPVLRKRFPDRTLRYSFDSADYYDIFADYDLVISTRVHGCGVAASLGIPSISLGHDFRSDTTDGFLAVSVDLRSDPTALNAHFETLAARAAEVSADLSDHRQRTLDSYADLIQSRLDSDPRKVDYGAGGVVPFVNDAPAGMDLSALEERIASLVPVADELDEVRSVLHAVEVSKAEIAAELDGARAAVARLEDELAALRAQQSAGPLAAIRRGMRSVRSR